MNRSARPRRLHCAGVWTRAGWCRGAPPCGRRESGCRQGWTTRAESPPSGPGRWWRGRVGRGRRPRWCRRPGSGGGRPASRSTALPPCTYVDTLRIFSPAHSGLCTARAAVPGVAARTCTPCAANLQCSWGVTHWSRVPARRGPLCVKDA